MNVAAVVAVNNNNNNNFPINIYKKKIKKIPVLSELLWIRRRYSRIRKEDHGLPFLPAQYIQLMFVRI